jgi:hypothetical protein
MMMGKVDDIAAAGVTHVWLPPPSHSVSNEGFLLPPVPLSSPELIRVSISEANRKNGEGIIEAWSGEHANFECDVQYDLPWSFS